MDIFELARSVSLLDVVEGYLGELKRDGRHYLGLCPFHNDTHLGSFKVTPNSKGKGLWKCFSCGETGDVIDFVAKIENISLHDAALKICVNNHLISAEDAVNTGNGALQGVRHTIAPKEQENLVQKRDEEHLHKVYMAFYRASYGLTPRFRAYLLEQRHVREADLDYYFVFPSPNDSATCSPTSLKR